VLEIIKDIPQTVLSGSIVAMVVLFLFVPIALRVAGLSGQQIQDVLAMTTRFFLELVREFRAENKEKP